MERLIMPGCDIEDMQKAINNLKVYKCDLLDTYLCLGSDDRELLEDDRRAFDIAIHAIEEVIQIKLHG